MPCPSIKLIGKGVIWSGGPTTLTYVNEGHVMNRTNAQERQLEPERMIVCFGTKRAEPDAFAQYPCQTAAVCDHLRLVRERKTDSRGHRQPLKLVGPQARTGKAEVRMLLYRSQPPYLLSA